jgi:type 1 glutamine amidotransferase
VRRRRPHGDRVRQIPAERLSSSAEADAWRWTGRGAQEPAAGRTHRQTRAREGIGIGEEQFIRDAIRGRVLRRTAWQRLISVVVPRAEVARRLAVIGMMAVAIVAIAACGASDGVSRSSAGSLAAARQPGRKVLVLTQTLGYRHASIPSAVDALRRLAARDGRYRVVFLSSASRLTPTALKGAAAVVFLLTSGELPLGRSGKHALLAFVHDGGGLVGFHSATDSFHHWPGYISMIGAEFSHHAVPSTERVLVEDGSTPATEGLPKRFAIHEEFYVFKHDPRSSVHVLVRLDTPRGGPDRPLVWCRRSGTGRVFYDALGHFPQTWSDPRQLVLVSGGIAWAAGLARAPSC